MADQQILESDVYATSAREAERFARAAALISGYAVLSAIKADRIGPRRWRVLLAVTREASA
jgi:hypothetical protein